MSSFVIDESYLDNLIASQRSAIRYYLIFALGIFILGIVVIIISVTLPKEEIAEGIKTLLSVGGGFVSSLSGFQIKEIIQRKEKINVFSLIKNQLLLSIKKGSEQDPEEEKRLKEIMWKTLEKTALM